MILSKKSNSSSKVAPTVRNFFDNFWNADPFFSEDIMKMRNRWMPAVNIKEGNGNFKIDVAAPGFTKDDFDVKVENGTLYISAAKEESSEEKDANYTRKEFSFNSFERSFSLPENADAKDVAAKYTDGVLKLTLKKVELPKPDVKKIEIK